MARGEDALTLLDNGSTRDHFMDDVMEVLYPEIFRPFHSLALLQDLRIQPIFPFFWQLESFLHQRLVEMELSDDVLMSSQFHSAPKILQPSTSQLQSMLDAVTVVRNAICNKRMEDLLMIRSSIRYSVSTEHIAGFLFIVEVTGFWALFADMWIVLLNL